MFVPASLEDVRGRNNHVLVRTERWQEQGLKPQKRRRRPVLPIGIGVASWAARDAAPPAAEAILGAVRDDDLFVVPTHGRGGIKRLVLGSVADKLIRGSSVPILVIRPRDR
jgi:nucleotide-binding universal stress UspA family protein